MAAAAALADRRQPSKLLSVKASPAITTIPVSIGLFSLIDSVSVNFLLLPLSKYSTKN